MNEQKIREEFEQWRDESPNQRYGDPAWEAWQAACASRQKEPSIKKYNEIMADEPNELSAVERLRFFCSLALSSQDWLDVEPFFDAIQKANDITEEPQPINPDEVYSPHTKVIE